MLKICKYCQVSFDIENGKVFSNHVKWCNKNPSSANKRELCPHCSLNFNILVVAQHMATCSLNPSNAAFCPECNLLIINRANKFCSSSCSATHNNKLRIMSSYGPAPGYVFGKITKTCLKCHESFEASKNLHKDKGNYCSKCYEKLTTVSRKCETCDTEMIIKKWKINKTCSRFCLSELLSKHSRSHPNCGGETNYKRFTYKNVKMDSSWEVKIAEYLDEKHIKWERNRKHVFLWTDKTGKKRRYYPDFWLPEFNCYLDPKNTYKLEQDLFKLNQVIIENKITLYYGAVVKLKNTIDGLGHPL